MQEQPLHYVDSESMWFKSQRSTTLNACVELMRDGEWVLLRDSKNPDTPLRYSLLEIDAFFDGVKRGEFDHLLDSGRN